MDLSFLPVMHCIGQGQNCPSMWSYLKPIVKVVKLCLLGLTGLSGMGAWASDGNIPLRWQEQTYRYWYNPANEPSWLSTEAALAMIRRAVSGWEICGVRMVYAGLTESHPGEFDGRNVIGWRTDGAKHSAWTHWRARRSTGIALEADITLYANIYDDYRRRGMNAELELYKSIAHELGYVLGLGHSDVASDAMSVRIRTRPEWQLPSERDIVRCQEYLSQP